MLWGVTLVKKVEGPCTPKENDAPLGPKTTGEDGEEVSPPIRLGVWENVIIIIIIIIIIIKRIFLSAVQLKKLLEHFTEVKQLMTMSHVKVCEKESFEMSLEDRQWWRWHDVGRQSVEWMNEWCFY